MGSVQFPPSYDPPAPKTPANSNDDLATSMSKKIIQGLDKTQAAQQKVSQLTDVMTQNLFDILNNNKSNDIIV